MSIFVPSFISHIQGITSILFWYAFEVLHKKAVLISEYLALISNVGDSSEAKSLGFFLPIGQSGQVDRNVDRATNTNIYSNESKALFRLLPYGRLEMILTEAV